MKIAAITLLAATFTGAPRDDTYSVVVAGMKCTQHEPAYQRTPQTECTFTVGKSLELLLVGVGQDDGAFTVFRSDIDGDYYVSIPAGTGHRCAIIKPGRIRTSVEKGAMMDMAFVSPRTGKVFRTWQDCAAD